MNRETSIVIDEFQVARVVENDAISRLNLSAHNSSLMHSVIDRNKLVQDPTKGTLMYRVSQI